VPPGSGRIASRRRFLDGLGQEGDWFKKETGSRRRLGQEGKVRIGRLTTLPDRMHEVQALTRFGDPSTRARTRWTFGFQRRLVRRCEWLMFIPNEGFLPQMSHTAAMTRQILPKDFRAGAKG